MDLCYSGVNSGMNNPLCCIYHPNSIRINTSIHLYGNSCVSGFFDWLYPLFLQSMWGEDRTKYMLVGIIFILKPHSL